MGAQKEGGERCELVISGLTHCADDPRAIPRTVLPSLNDEDIKSVKLLQSVESSSSIRVNNRIVNNTVDLDIQREQNIKKQHNIDIL